MGLYLIKNILIVIYSERAINTQVIRRLLVFKVRAADQSSVREMFL